MTQEDQLTESDPLYAHGVELYETDWKITLTASNPIELDSVHPETITTDEEWRTELDENDIIPNGVALNTVTLSVRGTYYDAYAEAIDTCEYLNEKADIPESYWEFDDKDVRQADQPDPEQTQPDSDN